MTAPHADPALAGGARAATVVAPPAGLPSGTVRRLLSFTIGSGFGLCTDVGGFALLVALHAAPMSANMISSSASIVVVYVFVSRRTFRAPMGAASFVLFAAWYAANICAVSLLIGLAVKDVGGPPLVWKLLCVPISFAANFLFNSLFHRLRSARRAGLRIDTGEVA